MQYNHGQSGSGNGNVNSGNNDNGNSSDNSSAVSAEEPAGVVLKSQTVTIQKANMQLLNTVKEDASIEGNGDGNGQVPLGLNRGEKGEKPDNPNKPDKPDNPGTEDSADKKANKAGKGTHKYGYDSLNRMTSSNIAGTTTIYTYDTLGNLVLEKTKNKVVDYQYNELNQLTKKKEGNESYNYIYDKRGNRVEETGKKESRSYFYDETNRMVEGTGWKGDKSAYTYNGLGLRVGNTQTTHAGKVYTRDYVTDYTSFENDDLMVFAEGNGQPEYEQKHVYAGSERTLQFTNKGNWERTFYVHEDVMGSTRYYTKSNGQSFAELTYDAWGMPQSPNKLLNNDHGNYVSATFTGHSYDTTLDIYFAEARFYDANNRTWLAMDPIKDGGNWYQYCNSNPATYWDPTGLKKEAESKQAQLSGSEMEPALFWRQRDFFLGHWWQDEEKLTRAYEMLLKESESRHMTGTTLIADYNYYDNVGYANTRVYTLQALIGAERTGIFDISTLDTLETVLISQNVDIGSGMIELTPTNLKAVRNWYDNQIEILKEGAYQLENGWGDILKGIGILVIGYAYRDVEVPSASEGNSAYTTGNEPVYNQQVLKEIEINKDYYRIDVDYYDCSEIADDLYKAAGEKGTIYTITPNDKYNLIVPEYGKNVSYDYHTVYSDNSYIYDPRYTDTPVLESEYFDMIKSLNPKGVKINMD